MELEIHYDDEDWAALYKDGQLVRAGDTYRTEEEAFALLGVTIVQDNAFMLGQGSAEGVAKTLEEVHRYSEERRRNLARAADMRIQAQRLLAEASDLEKR